VGDGGSEERWWLEIGKNGPPSSCPGGGRGGGWRFRGKVVAGDRKNGPPSSCPGGGRGGGWRFREKVVAGDRKERPPFLLPRRRKGQGDRGSGDGKGRVLEC